MPAGLSCSPIPGGHCRIVSGGWKKMPIEIKDHIRKAALDGGIKVRILHKPFVYLDKNYVRIFGGIKRAIQAVSSLERPVVIQVRGEDRAHGGPQALREAHADRIDGGAELGQGQAERLHLARKKEEVGAGARRELPREGRGGAEPDADRPAQPELPARRELGGQLGAVPARRDRSRDRR